MKRRLIAVLLALTLVSTVLAGCGPQETPTEAPAEVEEEPTEAAEAEEQEPEEEPAEAEIEKTKVVVWMAGDDARFMQDGELPQKFEEENPQYDVEVVQIPWDTLHDKLLAGFSGGELPDVSQGADHWVGEFAILGGLEPMSSFMEENGYNEDDFFPNSWEHFRFFDGEIYAAPFYWESRLLFYRPDLLEASNISEPPATLEEMMEAGKQLSAVEDQYGLAHQTSWLDFHFFSYLLYAYGGDYYNENRTECTLTDEAGIQALTYYQDLYEENVIPQDPEDRVETFAGYKNGFYSMAESGAWWLGLINSQAPDISWDIALLPEGETTLTYGHPNPWVVPKDAANKEGGKAWIAFMLEQENAVYWATYYGQTPTMLAAFDDPALVDSKFQQLMYEAGTRGTRSLHNIKAAETVSEIIWTELANVRDMVSTPEEAADNICTSIQQYLWTEEELAEFN